LLGPMRLDQMQICHQENRKSVTRFPPTDNNSLSVFIELRNADIVHRFCDKLPTITDSFPNASHQQAMNVLRIPGGS
jgi:hypothetical protein